MTKTLIIAEKPSVAQDIVRALTPTAGKFEKFAEHFENDRYVVTSAVGHLVEIKAPEEFDVKRGKWSFANLPVIPPHFDLAPIDKAKTRLNAVVKLVRRKDVTELINACDAGREGELIFRLIAQYAEPARGKLDKPVRRLWLQSMTPQAIRDGFEQAAHRRADAGPGRGRAQPLRGRLAGGHQRHARDDRVQLARRRLLPDHRRPGADAHAVHRRRARGEDPQARRARLLGDQGHLRRRRPASTTPSGSTRRSRRTTTPTAAPTACGTRPRPTAIAAAVLRPARQGHRGVQAQHVGQPAAVRPDQPAARGQRPLRLLGQDHAVAGAGAVREAQGADLPADGLARAARGLPAGGQGHAQDAVHRRPAGPAARAGRRTPPRRSRRATSSRPSACSTTPRCRITSPSSRRCRRPSRCPTSRPSCTTWSSSASSPCSSRAPNTRSRRA